MRAVRVCACAALALAASGCLRESTIEPIRETVTVHAILTVGRSNVGVAIGVVSTEGVQGPLNGASVQLHRGEIETTLTQANTSSSFCFAPGAASGAQCYAGVLSSPIQADETIGVTIEQPDGARIIGSTTTPTAPAIERPLPGSDVEVTFVVESGSLYPDAVPIEVRWTGTGDSPADVLLEVNAMFDDGAQLACMDDGTFTIRAEFTRSPAHVFPPYHCMPEWEDPLWDSAAVTLHVAGYDANARDYLEATDEPSVGIVLDGASPGLDVVAGNVLVSGVFGSAAHTTAPLTLHAALPSAAPREATLAEPAAHVRH